MGKIILAIISTLYFFPVGRPISCILKCVNPVSKPICILLTRMSYIIINAPP